MITISSQRFSAVFDRMGAQLVSLTDNQTQHEYLWEGNPEFWRFHAPILFPFVGRLRDDQYHYQGQKFDMHQHGFARESEFEVLIQEPNEVEFQLTDTPATRANYPFKFHLNVKYLIDEQGLSVKYQVVNPGEKPLLFSIGAHPAFNIRLDSSREFDHAKLAVAPGQSYSTVPLVGPYSDIDHPKQIDLTKSLALDRSMFEHDAIILALANRSVQLRLSDQTGRGVELALSDAPYVGIWSPYPKQAPFICIEPWWGIADRIGTDGLLDHKTGIKSLNPGQTSEMAYQIKPF